MKKNILFLFVFFCQAATANMTCTKINLSLKAIEQIAEEKSLSVAMKTIEENECFDSKRRLIPLLDKVEIMGQEKFTFANWLIPTMKAGEEKISIQMPTNFYSVASPFQADTEKYVTQPCDFNGASGGIMVITPKSQKLVIVETWSCGSGGCSFDFDFYSNHQNKNQDFCQF